MNTEPYILYIEDERPVLDLVCQALKPVGYEVVGVDSGERGLAMMRRQKPVLLLLDLMMPGLSGWEIYRAMKADAQLANVPVIVITAKVPDHDLKIADDLPPVEDYITKPFSIAQLIRSVQRWL